MYKAVIFDLDGTLLNTIDDLANACNYALKVCGFPIHEVEKYNHFVGDGRYKLIERILPEDSKDSSTIDKVLSLFDEYYERHMIDMTKPYNGICKMLDQLKDNDIKLAVVTNKPHEFAVDIVKNFFGEKFHITLGNRKDIPTKPNPHSVNEVIELFNIKKEQCIYVGDSNVDVQTAKNADIKCMGVAWGFRGTGELKEAGADIIVNNVQELIDVIIKGSI